MSSSLSAARLALSIRQLQNGNADVELLASEPVAIVGLGCRFPGGINSAAGYWQFLRRGDTAITEVPKDRWDADAWYSADHLSPGKTNGRWGGFLEGVDRFDPAFFGIAPREALAIDPQQRLLLEVAWEALGDAG